MSELAQAAPWSLPPIDGPVLNPVHRAADLDSLEREAWDKGFAEGREAGLAAASREQQAALARADQQLQRLGQILDCLAQPLAELDQQVEQELATLAGAIARQLVRRELRTHPDQIVALIRETVTLLPVAARDVRVHLHPEDATLVRSRLSEVTGDRAWSIVEDPVLTRGGCRISSERSTIDARLEQRLGTVIATALGDERVAPCEQELTTPPEAT